MIAEPALIVIEAQGKRAWFEDQARRHFRRPSIFATHGHLFHIPLSPTFSAEDLHRWQPVNAQVAAALSTYSEAKSVIIATDDDRDGELIGAHAAALIGAKPTYYRFRLRSLTPGNFEDQMSEAEQWSPNVRDVVLLRYFDLITGSRFSARNRNLPVGRVLSRALHCSLGFRPPSRIHVGREPSGWDCNPEVTAEQRMNIQDGPRLEDSQMPGGKPAFLNLHGLLMAGFVSKQLPPERTYAAAQRLYENGLVSYVRTASQSVDQDRAGVIGETAGAHGYSIDADELAAALSPLTDGAHEAIVPLSATPKTPLNGDLKAVFEVVQKQTLSAGLRHVYPVRVSAEASWQATWVGLEGQWRRCDPIYSLPTEEPRPTAELCPGNVLKMTELLSSQRLCAPGKIMHHAIKLAKYFDDDFNLTKQGRRALQHATAVAPNLLDKAVFEKSMEILANEEIHPYEALAESLRMVGADFDLSSLQRSKSRGAAVQRGGVILGGEIAPGT